MSATGEGRMSESIMLNDVLWRKQELIRHCNIMQKRKFKKYKPLFVWIGMKHYNIATIFEPGEVHFNIKATLLKQREFKIDQCVFFREHNNKVELRHCDII